MKSIVIFLTAFFVLIIHNASAENITAIKSKDAIPAAPKGIKVTAVTMHNQKPEALYKTLAENGFDIEPKPPYQGVLLIKELAVVAMVNGERKIITLDNLDEYKDIRIPAAITDDQSNSVNKAAEIIDHRTDSKTGFVLFGLLGAVAAHAAQNHDEESIPTGIVIMIAMMRVEENKKKPATVVVTAGANTEESPATLFEAAYRQLTQTFSSGYIPNEKSQ